ncbi:cyclophilin-like fold protein [Bacteroides sp. BFG-638]|uniref:Cyclophilin-like fold protein n=1 Tax=Bacteroides vicugnae TaxID=3037989 RepID=A0ABU5HMV8_9BACE|nr:MULTISPECIES: cyclophilin-like fold protein [unclassified Bacteroides]MCS2950838.1 cyclophilin-like fold protein [Bacteroides sp. BFG-638]MCS3314438.1 cyclophilin-like fold protein [Bacteroides sp. BFG-637]MDY7254323.1 cyclophilin-like fold protein [Bacteroides sp. A1-P5]MDY7257306.1 cyclophilin-like fold protein [Bacteroides sp. A2-P53]
MNVNRKIWLLIISLKRFSIYSFVILLASVWIACSEHPDNTEYPETGRTEINNRDEEPNTESMKIKITVGQRVVTAIMADNAAAQDFVSRLPLEVTLNDYNNTEKIFYPLPKLSIEGVKRGCAPAPGDITIYVPWGNVAIFYKKWSQSSDLILIGSIDGDGIRALNVPGDLTVRFERE